MPEPDTVFLLAADQKMGDPMRRLLAGAIAYIVLATVSAPVSFAGVTVHYQGKAKDAEAIQKVLAEARSAASRYGWEVKDAHVANASLTREEDGKEKAYKGPLTGIVIQAHPMCEPVHIQFGTDLVMRDFVKTQFAGADVHVKVIELLKQLKPLLVSLEVLDEGEYWDTGDKGRLKAQIAEVSAMMAAIRKSHPKAKGPVKIGSGRIVDIVQ